MLPNLGVKLTILNTIASTNNILPINKKKRNPYTLYLTVSKYSGQQEPPEWHSEEKDKREG